MIAKELRASLPEVFELKYAFTYGESEKAHKLPYPPLNEGIGYYRAIGPWGMELSVSHR